MATALTAVGLFTASWDRLANLGVAGYNVKLAPLAFSLAALGSLTLVRERRSLLAHPLVRVLAGLVAAIVLVLVLASAVSARPVAGLTQVVAVLTGSVAPLVALVLLLRRRSDVVWALRWMVGGAALSGAFGLYQLVAFYTGLPQLVPYTGLSVDGSAGRIAAFSYEPAYFANFMLLAAGAAMVIALLQGKRLRWLPIAGFSLVLVLVNVRALVFLLPILAVLLAFRWRQNRRVLLRAVVAGAIIMGLNAGASSVMTQLTQATAAQAPAAEAPKAHAGTAVPTPAAGAPDLHTATVAREPDAPSGGGTSNGVLDPNEQSSNAPRLALYSAVLRATAQHPLLGVGPGNLRQALVSVGYVAPNQGSQVVANNIWLQAFADGGIPLVLLELGVIVCVIVIFFKRGLAAIQPLSAAWLAVLSVSGMLTSYFFDVKIWAVLAILVAAAVLPCEEQLSSERKTAAL
ncbi:O-antigen ligase family protein [uncultured Amnibacterium sp.]|uniref:O-antigen ligase family protein n=1 Tax=uncultured Amnibacterium sp. TaxID=1631851 RepID=UPI0035CC24D3